MRPKYFNYTGRQHPPLTVETLRCASNARLTAETDARVMNHLSYRPGAGLHHLFAFAEAARDLYDIKRLENVRGYRHKY